MLWVLEVTDQLSESPRVNWGPLGAMRIFPLSPGLVGLGLTSESYVGSDVIYGRRVLKWVGQCRVPLEMNELR